MLIAFLIICAVLLTGLCIYALLKAASDADDITESMQEMIQEQAAKQSHTEP